MGQGQDHLANMIVRHTATSLAEDRLVCKCREEFANERRYAEHLAEMIESSLADVIQAERMDAQLSLLRSTARYFAGRPRSVYSGSQIEGWCRATTMALHRANGHHTGKAAKTRGNTDG